MSRPEPWMIDVVDETDKTCPCRSGETFATCCSPLLAGDKPAATATQLMRSRYTAFAVHDRAYVLRTWHPRTRPKRLVLDTDQEWILLEVLASARGGPFDTEGAVEFRAHFRQDGRRQSIHQISRFVRESGRWLYLDGEGQPSA